MLRQNTLTTGVRLLQSVVFRSDTSRAGSSAQTWIPRQTGVSAGVRLLRPLVVRSDFIRPGRAALSRPPRQNSVSAGSRPPQTLLFRSDAWRSGLSLTSRLLRQTIAAAGYRPPQSLVVRSHPRIVPGLVRQGKPYLPVTAYAVYAASDSTTRGTWLGSYGSQGYYKLETATPTLVSSLPAGMTASVTGATLYSWEAGAPTHLQDLQRVDGSTRDADTWYSDTSFTFRITPGSSDLHTLRRLSFYCLDWDGIGRTQTIAIKDHGTGTVLSTRALSSFSSGIWTQWYWYGDVDVVFTWTGSGTNAVTCGFFLDLIPAAGGVFQPRVFRSDYKRPGLVHVSPMPRQAGVAGGVRPPQGRVVRSDFSRAGQAQLTRISRQANVAAGVRLLRTGVVRSDSRRAGQVLILKPQPQQAGVSSGVRPPQGLVVRRDVYYPGMIRLVFLPQTGSGVAQGPWPWFTDYSDSSTGGLT